VIACWCACTSTLDVLQWRAVAKERESAVRSDWNDRDPRESLDPETVIVV
jgi:hypothetical protein